MGVGRDGECCVRRIWSMHTSYLNSFIIPGKLSYSLCGYIQRPAFSSSSDIQLLVSFIPACRSCRNPCGSSPVCPTTSPKYKSPWNLLLLTLASCSFQCPPVLDSELSPCWLPAWAWAALMVETTARLHPSQPEADVDGAVGKRSTRRYRAPRDLKSATVEGRGGERRVQSLFHQFRGKGQQRTSYQCLHPVIYPKYIVRDQNWCSGNFQAH